MNMTAPVTVPTAPPLANVRDVELMHAGTWRISTGTFTFTADDFAAAVGALDCPAVRRPVLKLGHVDPRFDGEPAVGWIDNLASIGGTLVGDYVGMPGWLGDVIASAYPDRSIEGQYDFKCQIGHVHPFVLTGVALLGVTAPGIGTLNSLQDVAALYGVAASSSATGSPVVITVRASKEAPVPNPRPTLVAAGVTTEDVRRAYYEAAPYSVWISQMELDPALQLITLDDNDGSYARVPVTIVGDQIAFGTPVPVQMTFVDKPATTANASAGGDRPALVYASRAESRPDPGATPKPPADQPGVAPTPRSNAASAAALIHNAPVRGAGMDPAKLREALGLTAEASDDEVTAALAPTGLAPAGNPPATPPTQTEPAAQPVTASTPRLPDGVVAVEAAVLDELRRNAQAGAEARQQQRADTRDRTIDAAVQAGKIAPARKDHWAKSWDADPEGTQQTLASLEPGLVVPVTPAGYTGTGQESGPEDAEYAALEAALYPEYARSGKEN